MSATIEIRRLTVADVGLLGRIDRSEQLEVTYRVAGGELVAAPDDFFIPPWNPEGDGEHSVAAMVRFAEPIVRDGAELLGAYRGEKLLGLAVVDPDYGPELAWLALLHVTQSARRGGVAGALWAAAAAIARDGGRPAMYVSATGSGSAVGFYLSRGCRLAAEDEIIPDLYELEPKDVHFVCEL